MAESTVTLETPPELERPALVDNKRSIAWITDKVSVIVEAPTPLWWWVAFLPCSVIALIGLFCIGYQISNGVGVWGENKTVGWAWDITNFVFWIGIGHAGTLISAILFLTRQKWRTSINRAAEAMTLFAVTMTLFCHHFDNESLVKLFKQLKQQSHLAVVINDIHRHWFAYHSIAWITKLFLKSYLVKNDAKLSVWRAFRKSDLKTIIQQAGFTRFSIKWKWAFRWEVVLFCD